MSKVYRDIYGNAHRTGEERDFANKCYDMMKYLTEVVALDTLNAELLVSNLQDNAITRDKFDKFIKDVRGYHGQG